MISLNTHHTSLQMSGWHLYLVCIKPLGSEWTHIFFLYVRKRSIENECHVMFSLSRCESALQAVSLSSVTVSKGLWKKPLTHDLAPVITATEFTLKWHDPSCEDRQEESWLRHSQWSFYWTGYLWTTQTNLPLEITGATESGTSSLARRDTYMLSESAWRRQRSSFR